MKTLTNTTDVSAAFFQFEPDHAGAFATCRLIAGASSAMDPQEWAELGTIDGAPAKVYYIFSGDEASGEEADSYPWDVDHISKIEIAEPDDDGDFDNF